MFHDIDIEEWDDADENESIVFTPDELPSELYEVFRRFTRIPHYQDVLPFLVAYELTPLNGLSSIPLIFCRGKTGSGKSTYGEISQRLNQRHFGDDSYLQSSDTAKGWEQNIPSYRLNHKGLPKAFPLVFIDDLVPSTFTSVGGDLKLALLKQMVNSNGAIRRGGADGTPLTIEVFIKTITGSIHDLPSIEGLHELERRSIIVEHKNIEEWDEEHDEYTRENPIENHCDYRFHSSYDEIRHIWFNQNANKIKTDRSKVKKYLKTCDTIPKNRAEFLYPILAMAISCGFYSTPLEAATKFRDCFLRRVKMTGETALQSMICRWVHGDTSPYQKRIALWNNTKEELREYVEIQITYSEVAVFLRTMIRNMELTSKDCKRQEVVAAMGLAGFEVGSSEMETVFTYKGK